MGAPPKGTGGVPFVMEMQWETPSLRHKLASSGVDQITSTLAKVAMKGRFAWTHDCTIAVGLRLSLHPKLGPDPMERVQFQNARMTPAVD